MPENIQNTDPAAEEKKLSDRPEAAAEEPKETPDTDKKDGKKKGKKNIFKTILLVICRCCYSLILSLVILLALLLIFIDQILVFTVTKGGTYALGTNVQVETINLSLKKGTLLISKFSLDNPEGFSDKKAVELNRLFVSLDTDSLFTNKIIVRDIDINALNVSVESGGKNFEAIQKNIEKKFGSGKKKKKTEEKPSETKVVIKHLKIADSTIYLDIIPIPIRLELNDIGGEKGSSWKELKESCTKGWNSTANSAAELGNKTVDGIKSLFK